jgi:sugar lactone lactonase YvrE
VKVIAESRHGLKRPIQALFAADGATMFVGDNGANCVFKVDVASGRVEVFVKKGDAGLTEPSALAIDGEWLYVGSREGKQILRFSLSDGKPDGKADGKPFATLPDNPEFLMRLKD